MTEDNSSDSDYTVEKFVKPDRIKKIVNDDSADLLGNFDDQKRNEIFDGTYVEKEVDKNPSDSESLDDDEDEDDEDEEDDEEGDEEQNDITDASSVRNTDNKKENDRDTEMQESDDGRIKHPDQPNQLSKDQVTSLLRGAAKANRFVIYATNLNFETTRADLETHFGAVGTVKSVRIPKKTRGGFAFVEMEDINGFHKALQQHNTMLLGRQIKVQISEAGKKKSANKRNILKQKNRKLAEMRREVKAFTKSGKFYDKGLKKDKAKELLARKRWRKKPSVNKTKP